MLRATEVIDAAVPAAVPAEDSLTLPFELRQKSRLVARTDAGRQILLQLPRGGVLRHGTRLRVSDGTVLEVRAAAESLSVVESDSPIALLRAAYHLGNRHVALQIEAHSLRYLHDHVLDDMLVGLGLAPRAQRDRFEPEHGAYGHGHGHAHAPAPQHSDGHQHEHEGHQHEHEGHQQAAAGAQGQHLGSHGHRH